MEKYLDNKIKELEELLYKDALSTYGGGLLDAYKDLKEQLALCNVMDRLPESDYIKQQAQQMDEKEFDQWWWETVYKGN